ncbi:MAG TPA: low molecular weight protein arginine phosphatase, partial [bacterium]|nr:low molecular weight protein arginine phosphatase [bacterium]
MPKKVLFVCTGNTCRSPIAEGLLKKKAQDHQIPLDVQSAGFAAFAGVPPASEAVEACRE